MCGRFTLTAEIEDLKERFRALFTAREYNKRYNIAPSQMVLAIVNDGKENRMGYMKWGLIPSWAKDPSVGYRMINARAETAADKPAFRQAFQQRRCLILADSFYEWKKEGRNKIPSRILLTSEEPFAMAGLYEKWVSPFGENVFSCTILTTEANELISPLHDRMPVILTKEGEGKWLDRTLRDGLSLSSLLRSYPGEEMKLYQVSSEVNSPKFENPICITNIE